MNKYFLLGLDFSHCKKVCHYLTGALGGLPDSQLRDGCSLGRLSLGPALAGKPSENFYLRKHCPHFQPLASAQNTLVAYMVVKLTSKICVLLPSTFFLLFVFRSRVSLGPNSKPHPKALLSSGRNRGVGHYSCRHTSHIKIP